MFAYIIIKDFRCWEGPIIPFRCLVKRLQLLLNGENKLKLFLVNSEKGIKTSIGRRKKQFLLAKQREKKIITFSEWRAKISIIN